MTKLSRYKITDAGYQLEEETDDHTRIAAAMAQIGVGFERWTAPHQLPPGADQAAIMAAYQIHIDSLMALGGYKSVDVVRMVPDHPDRAAMRDKFLHEHIHNDDEVRFFVEGAGAFYLRVEDQVYRVMCMRDDLLSVPKGMRHWFDMGDTPSFCAIRLFTTPDGWQAQFTGDPVADRIPGFSQ